MIYQWRKDGANIAGATTSSLTMAAVSTSDAGAYDVVVSGICGTTTSSAAALTVYNSTSITTQPANQSACAGSPATFSVTASGTTLSYQWRKNGTNISGATSSTFNLASVVAGDVGSYDVMVTGACSSVTSNAASLTVNTPPSVITNPVDQTVCAGGNVSLTASASGSPAPTVQWQVSTDGGANFSDLAGASSPTLTFAASTAQNGNKYRAVFTNTCSTATSAAATLTVNRGANITAQPTDQTVCAGAPANFSVTASGTGPFTYQWRKNGTALTGATNSSLSLASVTASDAGAYDVIVSAACGSLTSNPATLAINAVTSISAQPVSLNKAVGEAATFSVTAAGASLRYQWRKNSVNLSGATTSSFTLASVVASDAGNYDVVVTGACGTVTSNTATLTVGCSAISIAPATLPAGAEDAFYQQTLTVTLAGGNYTFALTNGTLLQGLTLSSAGLLSGTPTHSGTFSFRVTATGSGACSGLAITRWSSTIART